MEIVLGFVQPALLVPTKIPDSLGILSLGGVRGQQPQPTLRAVGDIDQSSSLNGRMVSP